MPVILGTGAYRYEVVDGWAKLPSGLEFDADVAVSKARGNPWAVVHTVSVGRQGSMKGGYVKRAFVSSPAAYLRCDQGSHRSRGEPGAGHPAPLEVL